MPMYREKKAEAQASHIILHMLNPTTKPYSLLASEIMSLTHCGINYLREEE